MEPESPNPNFLFVEQLFTITTLLRRSGDKNIFQKFGLTTNLYAVLIKIQAGLNTIKELLELIEGSPASITKKLKSLEEKKLITRTLDSIDKRKWEFELTPEGENVMNNINKVYNSAINELLANFSEQETKTMYSKLIEIEKRLKQP